MSEKYGNLCATYNIPLNISTSDIFRIGCAHLYHFLHINSKTDDCKPMMLKMHLELDDHPPSSIGCTEERKIEHNSSINGLRQCVQHHEEEIKALKHALLQAKEIDVVNRIDKAPDIDNNATQESNSNKKANNGNNLSGEHLELDDSSSSIGGAEERNIEHNSSINGLRQSVQQLEEEMKALKHALLQAKEIDVVNRIDKAPDVDNNATQESNSNKKANNGNNLSGEHLELDDSSSSIGGAEERNIEHNSSINGLRQSIQQLELEMKAVKHALLQAKEIDVVNRIDKAPDVDNNATQESNSNKQSSNENNLSGEHNDTENVTKASEGHHTNTMPEEKPEVVDLRDNCVYIQNVKGFFSSLKEVFYNVRKLANDMSVTIPDDSIIHIDVKGKPKNRLDYYVHFCNADIKKEFLKNRHFLKYHPETSPLRIFDYNEWGIVDIENFSSSDWSLKTAYVNVIGIAKKMGIFRIRDYIDHIDVFSTKPDFLTYSVRFNNNFHKNEFVRRKDNLKQFPETKSLEILDAGGHRLNLRNVNNVSVTVASANVIGVAELIGLSLATDNFQRIYVLNCVSYFVDSSELSFVVEFSSMEVKDEFLKRKHNLEKLTYFYSDTVGISGINAKRIVVSIKYSYDDVATAISFIGLAKQLGFSLTTDQIQHFFDLSKFIDDTKRRE